MSAAFSLVCLNGAMDMTERKRVQDAFAKVARILISTDAGGEGLNLQFVYVKTSHQAFERLREVVG
nr:helicase-related protein [Hydrogenophilus thermoluteolus]